MRVEWVREFDCADFGVHGLRDPSLWQQMWCPCFTMLAPWGAMSWSRCNPLKRVAHLKGTLAVRVLCCKGMDHLCDAANLGAVAVQDRTVNLKTFMMNVAIHTGIACLCSTQMGGTLGCSDCPVLLNRVDC